MARARKRFAQHFLEPAWVGKLVTAIAPEPGDHFIEIGPGRGAITEPLAARVASVVAVEVDRDLAAALEARGFPNVTVVTEDVLEVDLLAVAGLGGTKVPPSMSGGTEVPPSVSGGTEVPPSVSGGTEVPPSIGTEGAALAAPIGSAAPIGAAAPVRIAGNLPYNISSPILFKLLAASEAGRFKDAHLMLQKEVADRLIARPGTGDYGVLTLSTMLRADVTRVLSLPPGAFRPAPTVHSAVVRLAFRPPPPDVEHPDLVIAIVRSVFTQRRKTMANALAPFATSRGASARGLLTEAGIDPQARPEVLTLSDFARLSRVCAIVSP